MRWIMDEFLEANAEAIQADEEGKVFSFLRTNLLSELDEEVSERCNSASTNSSAPHRVRVERRHVGVPAAGVARCFSVRRS